MLNTDLAQLSNQLMEQRASELLALLRMIRKEVWIDIRRRHVLFFVQHGGHLSHEQRKMMRRSAARGLLIVFGTVLTFLLIWNYGWDVTKKAAPDRQSIDEGRTDSPNTPPMAKAAINPRPDDVGQMLSTLLVGKTESDTDSLLSDFRADVDKARRDDQAALYRVFKTLQRCLTTKSFNFSMLGSNNIPREAEDSAKSTLDSLKGFCALAEAHYNEGIAHALERSAALGYTVAVLDRARTTYGVTDIETWAKQSLDRLKSLSEDGNTDAKLLLAMSFTDGIHGTTDYSKAAALLKEVTAAAAPNSRLFREAAAIASRMSTKK